ncbi:MAG: type II secretion system F family protein [Gemmatimonadaceae bacterium]
MSAASRVTYAYQAARADGALERGAIDAESRDAASASLVARGLFPVDIKVSSTPSETRRSKVPVADLALGLRVLATLLESGLPVGRALQALADLAPASWKAAIPELRESVRQGQSLAASLDSSSVVFPPLVIGIVKAGEGGSGLSLAVRRAAELMESAAATRSALRSALAYPLILAIAGSASVALLVGVVLPRFAAILADLGQALPATTRLVLVTADMVRVGAVPALITLAVSAVVWHGWTATESGRRRWHEVLLLVPIAGPIRRSAATARACAALTALLESGVPISNALFHASRATGDWAVASRLLAAREMIVAGQSVARSLAEHEGLTPTAVRLVRAGEETGRLANMLAHAARIESERAEESVKRAVRLIEPALILVFGAVVALIAASLLEAIYSVRPSP